MADQLGDWAFGCDICQDVCPWNRKAPGGASPGSTLGPSGSTPTSIAWLDRDPAEFARALKGSALARSKRSGLVRNAALILGTRRSLEAVPALIGRLGDPDRSSGRPRPGPWADRHRGRGGPGRARDDPPRRSARRRPGPWRP